ncbi:hypothetical protein DL96DRAFT_1711312 [Flagelloscypha sp. PMI_526]|nr:hypothetical protein DL96DRAFT_1711312 [Flagelloscypha sp. PMI_526]
MPYPSSDSLGDFLSLGPGSCPIHALDNHGFFPKQCPTSLGYDTSSFPGLNPSFNARIPPSNRCSRSNLLNLASPLSGNTTNTSSLSSAESADDMDVEDMQAVETVPPLPPNATLEDGTIWLRGKNTLSARKHSKLRAMKGQ